ncbi:hypothetical protein L6452_39983 [Arctium lappa]|uniref:Uncharacterized protein n=1 Tax=Arctium lappa TaxID=4217 RepID=A0ACB8XV12_ARCLA|nr:hypothetical protein L6452_39983 [Arctium lappa]
MAMLHACTVFQHFFSSNVLVVFLIYRVRRIWILCLSIKNNLGKTLVDSIGDPLVADTDKRQQPVRIVAGIAQLGERQTEDLKVTCSIHVHRI